MNLSSKLIPKVEIPKVRDLISSHSDHDLMSRMRKMAYESYNCRIFEVQVILTMEAHKLIPTDLDEILTIDRMNQGKNYGKRTRCCNSITLELFQFKMLPLIGVY